MKIDKKIKKFIRDFNQDGEIIEESNIIRLDLGYPKRECHNNVVNRISEHGGFHQYCWIIVNDETQEDDSYLQGIFHSLWRDSDNNLFEITPVTETDDIQCIVLDNIRILEFDNKNDCWSTPFMNIRTEQIFYQAGSEVDDYYKIDNKMFPYVRQ